MSQSKTAHAGKVALLAVASLLVATMWMLMSSSPVKAQTEPYSSETPSVLPTTITNDDDDTPPDDVLDERIENDDDAPEDVAADERENSGVLPFTGGDVVLFLVVGTAAVGTGLLLVRKSRS